MSRNDMFTLLKTLIVLVKLLRVELPDLTLKSWPFLLSNSIELSNISISLFVGSIMALGLVILMLVWLLGFSWSSSKSLM